MQNIIVYLLGLRFTYYLNNHKKHETVILEKNCTISKSKKLENELNRTPNETCYFENMQYFNIGYKILPTPFQCYSSYRLLNVVRYGGEIQCLKYLLCDILKYSLYLRPPGDCYCKQILIHYASDHLSK